MPEGRARVHDLRALFYALAGRLAGDAALGPLGLPAALAVLRQHFHGEIVAEDLGPDVVVGRARADMHPEGPAADLGLADGRLGAVLLVPDLADQVVGELVVVADLQLRALRPQVGLIPSLRPVGVVSDLGRVVAVQVFIGAPLELPVDGGVMDADLLGDVHDLHAGAPEGVDLRALRWCQVAEVFPHGDPSVK